VKNTANIIKQYQNQPHTSRESANIIVTKMYAPHVLRDASTTFARVHVQHARLDANMIKIQNGALFVNHISKKN